MARRGAQISGGGGAGVVGLYEDRIDPANYVEDGQGKRGRECLIAGSSEL